MATPGSKAQIMYGRETTYGTAVSVTKVFDLVTSYDLRLGQPEIEGYGIGTRDQQIIEAGAIEGVLTIEGIIQLGYPIIEAIGDATASGSAPYLHTVAPNSTVDEVPALTIEVGADMTTDSGIILAGCRCNSLTMRFSKDAPVTFSQEFWFKEITEGTSITAMSPLSESAMLFSMGLLKIPVATTVAEVESGELTLANNLFRTPALGSRKQSAYGAGRKFTFTGDVNYDGPDLLDLALGADGAVDDTEVDVTTLQLSFDNGGSAAASRKIDFKTSTAMITDWGQKSSIDAAIIEDIAVTLGLLDGDANNYIQLSNNTATM